MAFDYDGQSVTWDELQRIQHADNLTQRRAAGEYIIDSVYNNAQQVKANQLKNAQIRAERRAETQRAEDAKHAALLERMDAQALAAQDAFKHTARAAFPGTQAEFDAAWPEILKQWQIRNAVEADASLVARKRAMLGGVI